MDEPFANIDIALRRRLREDIRHLLKAKNMTAIMVTHDPEEAMELGDKIAIMEGGEIVQMGRPDMIYHAPRSLAVARLTCDGAVLRATRQGHMITSDFGHWAVEDKMLNGITDQLDLYLRPLSAQLSAGDVGDDGDKPIVTIADIRQTGPLQIVTLQSASGARLSLQLAGLPQWYIGQIVHLVPDFSKALLFPA